MTHPSEQPEEDSGSQTYKGPANWFSMTLPNELLIQQTEAFVEVKPRRDIDQRATQTNDPPPWSMTLYSAWVPEEGETGSDPSHFDPSRLFPGLLRSQEIESQSLSVRLVEPGEVRAEVSRAGC